MPFTTPTDSLMPWQSIMLQFEGQYRASRKAKRVEVVREIYQAVYDDCHTKGTNVGLNLEAFAHVCGLYSTKVSH